MYSAYQYGIHTVIIKLVDQHLAFYLLLIFLRCSVFYCMVGYIRTVLSDHSLYTFIIGDYIIQLNKLFTLQSLYVYIALVMINRFI